MKRNLVRTYRSRNQNRTSDCRVKSHNTCTVLLIALAVCASSADPARGENQHTESPPFGFDLSEGWFDPPVHSHLSHRGTPMIHSFRTEPAFTQRDILLDYSTRNETGRDEQEIAAEVEWPLSRRLGLIFEIPYVFVDDDDAGAVEGFGNLAISPRVLLAEYERFLLAFNLEVETTTGTTRGNIASDEVALAPSFSTWVDLGNWWALNAQSGVEYPTESSDSEFFFRSSLIHTFGSQDDYESDHAHHEHGHASTHGLFSIILEADLALGLSGPEDGDWFAEGIVGVLVGLWNNADARVGYQFPLSRSQDLNNGVTAGLLWHFK
jgi:hypothetical protein